MKKRLAEFTVIFSMWVLLTWSIKIEDILAGLVVAFFVTILTRKLFPNDFLKLLNPGRFLLGVLYIPYLVFYIFLANLDVAYRVLNPYLPINPGIVRVKTNLKNDFAKTILANSITLTPGTLTVEVDGDDFYVHWINVSSDNPDIQKELILGRFERMLGRIFE
jgi:multicomponent Na+:H+ antiporter subunit E